MHGEGKTAGECTLLIVLPCSIQVPFAKLLGPQLFPLHDIHDANLEGKTPEVALIRRVRPWRAERSAGQKKKKKFFNHFRGTGGVCMTSLLKLQSVTICLRSMPSLAGSPAAAQSLVAMQHNLFSTAHAGTSNGLAAFQPHCCSHWPTVIPAQGRSWSPLPWHMQVGPAHGCLLPHIC